MRAAFKTLLVFTLVLSCFSCERENIENEKSRFFIKLYGNILQEEGIDILQTIDGGYILLGSTNSTQLSENKNRDIYLVRTNSEGAIIWERTYGGEFDDNGVALEFSDQGYYVLGNQTNGEGLRNILLLNVQDSDGEPIWQSAYGKSGSDYTSSDLTLLSDGNLVVTGSTSSLIEPNVGVDDKSDIVLIKFDQTGSLLVDYNFGGSQSESDLGRSGVQTSDSTFLLLGSTYVRSTNDTPINTAKLVLQNTDIDNELPASGGRSFWDIDGQDHSAADIISLNDGYIIAGNRTVDNNREVFIQKVDLGFNNSFSFPTNPTIIKEEGGDTELVSMLRLSTGFIVLGTTNSFSGSDRDIFISKFDDTGAQLWRTDSRIFGAQGDDFAGRIIQTQDGGLAMICTISVDGRSDVNRNTELCLIKMNSEGEIRP